MDEREPSQRISLYIPKRWQALGLRERLLALSRTQDRSVNDLIIDALLEYAARVEAADDDGNA